VAKKKSKGNKSSKKTLTIVHSILVILAVVVIAVNLFGDKLGLSPPPNCYIRMDGKGPDGSPLSEKTHPEFLKSNGHCTDEGKSSFEQNALYCRKTGVIEGSVGDPIEVGDCVECKDDSYCGPLIFGSYVPGDTQIRIIGRSLNNKKCITEDDQYICRCKKNRHCDKFNVCKKEKEKEYGSCAPCAKNPNSNFKYECRKRGFTKNKFCKASGESVVDGNCGGYLPVKPICCQIPK
jgi:hypothetical protein